MSNFTTMAAAFFSSVALLSGAQFLVPQLMTVPMLDGVIEASEWKQALAFSGAPDGELRKQTFYIGYTPEGLYMAVRSEMPPRGDLATLGRQLVLDDSLELWFVPPLANRTPGPLAEGKFQFIVNHHGKTYTRQHDPGWGLAAREWDSKTQIKMSKQDGWWDAEFFFPAERFGFKALTSGDWKMLFARNFAIHPVRQVNYTDAGNDYMRSDLFSTFSLSGSAETVQQLYCDSKRVPLQFVVSAPPSEQYTLTVRTDGKESVSTLSGGTYSQIKSPGQSQVEFTVLNARKQIVMHRKIKVCPGDGRVWFNLESFTSLHHDFNKGWNKVDFADFAKPVSIVISGAAPLVIPGRAEEQKAMRLPPGTRLTFKNARPAMPGAIKLWLRPSGSLTAKPNRYFGTVNPPARYMFYQESMVENAPYFHFGSHNLTAPLPNQYNLTSRSTSLIQDEWNLVVLNVKADGIDFFLNGKNIANKQMDFTGNAEYGELVLGKSDNTVNLDISEVTLYTRPLATAEIVEAMVSKSSINGELAFFPGLNSVIMAVGMDSQRFPELEVSIWDETKKNVFRKIIKTSAGHSGKKLFTLREKLQLEQVLPDGNYFIRLMEPGGKKVLLEKFFEHKHFPWLHNQIGNRDCVLPGFEPVKADGRKLSVVLRDYMISTSGFPEQVLSEGCEVLARPVTLFTEHSGNTEPLRQGSYRMVSCKDTAAEFTASSSNFLLRCDVRGSLEQDGLLKLDITLNPRGKILPDRVWLDIPVRKEVAELFHASGEGMRANPAGFLPSGHGRIWGSRSIPQIKINNFIPYCWVGGDRTGIAYAADWDQGWCHCDQRDAVELHRDAAGTVTIRLNIINHPAKIDPQRTITIALMASPVKLMPAQRRNWCDGFPFKAERNAQCLYSPAYWGGYCAEQGRYPAFKDFNFIRKLLETQRTGKVDQQFRDAWLERVKKASPEQVPQVSKRPPEYVPNHFDGAQQKMLQLHGMKEVVVYPYTCNYYPTDRLPENRFFKDEWRDMHVYGSFADYAIYYFDKMLEAGFSGIYNDNTYMVANYDWASGNAWIDDDDVVHPSLGIWRQRAFFRRQYVTMLDRGIKEPWITVHHTNANVLPALGFATNSMGMEWKYGITDFQTRFSSDYIRAVCHGQQGGFYPTVLDGIPHEGTAEQRSWCTRTMLAVLLPHEIRPTAQRFCDVQVYEKIHNLLYDFGIGKTDCRAVMFWEKTRPVSCSAEELLITTYERDNKMLLVCGNYGDDFEGVITFNSPVVRVTNLETEQSLPVSKTAANLVIKKHDLALIQAEFLNP